MVELVEGAPGLVRALSLFPFSSTPSSSPNRSSRSRRRPPIPPADDGDEGQPDERPQAAADVGAVRVGAEGCAGGGDIFDSLEGGTYAYVPDLFEEEGDEGEAGAGAGAGEGTGKGLSTDPAERGTYAYAPDRFEVEGEGLEEEGFGPGEKDEEEAGRDADE